MTVTARTILANTGYRLVADIGAKVASVALIVVMARRLGESQFGLFTFSIALVTLVTALADFGQDKILTREVARDTTRVGHYFLNTLTLKLAVSLPALVLGIAVIHLGGGRTEQLLVGLLGLSLVVEMLTRTVFATYQAFDELRYIPIVLISERFLGALAGIAAILAGGEVVAVVALLLVSAAAGFVLSLVLLFRHVVRPGLVLDVRSWPALMLAAAPIGVAGIFAVILFRVDTVILALFEPKQVVGEYGAAYRLFEATLFISWAVGAAVYPTYSRSSRRTSPAVGTVYAGSVKLLVALTLPIAAGAALLAEPLVDLIFGAAYEDTATALRLLAPAIALYPVAYLATYLLISQERSSRVTLTFAITALQNIACNLVLIPAYSLNGAALTTSLSELLSVGMLLWFGRAFAERREGARVLTGPVTATLAAAVPMAAFAGHLALAVGLGAAVYVLALGVIERALFPQDVRTLRDAIRPRSAGGVRARQRGAPPGAG
jgi:O-antigen/teichoic acid export membrane protein